MLIKCIPKTKASFRIQFLDMTWELKRVMGESLCEKQRREGFFFLGGGGGKKTKISKKHQTSAWRPACNLTPVASYITCHEILYIRDLPTLQITILISHCLKILKRMQINNN